LGVNVNSYAVFGEKRHHYANGFPTNLRQHFTLYPDWTLWVYTDREWDDQGYCKVLRKLADEGLIRVTIVPDNGECYQQRAKCMMMLWRLLPIWEDTEYVFCRDLDSILTPRQLQCVRSFIESGCTAHGINDNVSHDIALMGGMCGFKSKEFRAIYPSLNDVVTGFSNSWDNHGTDQNCLMGRVWQNVSGSSLIHRLSGPNRRSHLKGVTQARIRDINHEVLHRGDDFTNYIGAVGNSTPDPEIIAFYNEYGNQEKCRIITQIEKDCNL
jgi:hypothetical protein